MTPAARIQAAIELLAEVMDTPRPADALTSAYFRSRRFIGSKDRQSIITRLYRLMRAYYRLSWWVRKANLEVSARTLAIAGMVLDREHTAKSIDMIFSGERYAPEPLKRGEMMMVEMLEDKVLVPADMPETVRCECPPWAEDSLRKALGQRFEVELTAMLDTAPLDVRVNTVKGKRDDVLKQLIKEGYEAEAGKHAPNAIRLFGRPHIVQHPLFLDGVIEIQDEGSQMVAVVADAKPGEQVVDFCAGAGGKTLALAANMANKGRVVAMDVLGGRLERAKERFRRAGLHNIETRALTSERDKYVKRHQDHFDLVLVDAPCSGTGTWRRDPDKRWRQLGPGLETLIPLQKNILDSAYRMVKPGGRLVYATCSLLPDENEDQVDAFLAANPQFKRVGEDLKMSPAAHNTDGFYAAVLVRDAKAKESVST